MTDEAGVTLEKFGDHRATINGQEYHVLDYVEAWFTRYKLRPGSVVDISWSAGTTEKTKDRRNLTKIAPHRDGASPDKTGKSPVKGLSGIFRGTDGTNATIFVDGRDRYYCLKKSMVEQIKEIAPNQEIAFGVDGHNFITQFTLGKIVDELPAPSPPPSKKEPDQKQKDPEPETTDEKKPDTTSASQPSQLSSPPAASPVEPDNQSGDPIITTTPESTRPRTVLIGGVINLGDYNNIRVEVSGDVDPSNRSEIEDLIRLWDDTICSFGNESEVTKTIIDAYRKRVIMGAIPP